MYNLSVKFYYLYRTIEFFMEKKIEFAPNLMLIDASYLDRVGQDMAKHFSPIVKRELPKADLATLLECLALDAGIALGENAVQVIFVYDEESKKMSFCSPSDMEKELNNVAFQSQIGEFSIYTFQPSDMATREALFIEALMLADESKDVKRIIAVSDEDAYIDKAHNELEKIKGKETVVLFGMNPPLRESSYKFEMLGFPILQALGIRSEEL